MTEKKFPSDWLSAPLWQVAEVGAGNPAPQGKENFSPDGIPFVRVQDMGRLADMKLLQQTTDRVNQLGASQLKLFPKGTVLLTKSGASTLLNQRAVLGQDSYVVSHIATVRASSATSPDWLYYFLKTVDAAQLAHGGNMPSLPLSRVNDISIPIAPLNEQNRIVDKIETLFAHIDKGEEALREVQKLLKRYRQSILKAAVTGELTRDWREANQHKLEPASDLLDRILKARRDNWRGRGRYMDPIAAQSDRLSDPPESWTLGTTEQLSFVETGATPKKSEPDFYSASGINWITSTAVNDDPIRTPQAHITERAIRETNAKPFPAGTLIVAMYGEGKTRGKVSELGFESATNQACAALLVQHLPSEVARYLKLFYLYNYEAIRRQSAGGVQPNLNLSIIKATEVPIPSEEEINEILNRVNAELARIDELQRICINELRRSVALRQSILKSAFTGQLVPQDPNDEPASKLLARIRAERDSKPKKRSKKKAVKKTGIKTR